MKVAILIAPRDFKDETVSSLELFLGKKDIESALASLTLKECKGCHGATVKPKIEARELEPSAYDVLLIADGPGVDTLRLFDQRPLLDLIKVFHDSKKIIVGVGNGIKVVARANIIKDTKIAKTGDEEVEKLVRLYRGVPTDDAIVFDNKVLTLADSDQIAELAKMLEGSLGNM
jgi:putative intracellular protease/amidase